MSSGNKTEQPTQRRLLKARDKGQFPVSREFLAGTQFLVFVWLLSSYGPLWLENTKTLIRGLLLSAFRPTLGIHELVRFVQTIAHEQMKLLGILGALLIVCSVAMQLVTTNFGLATSRLMPDLERLNPISRLKQLPRQNIPALVQAVLLLPLFLYALSALLEERFQEFLMLPLGTIHAAAAKLGLSLSQLLWRGAALFFLFGCFDMYRQRRRHQSDLRMTKQEVKDEHKEVEGDPHLKARIRRLQRDLLRRNMMKAIPTATAVVVNPTHFAVAIKYDAEQNVAPMVIAKGKNYLARRIRELAEQHRVPIVENVPLAQALYKSVAVGQEIPPHLYRAVAEILAYIYRVMNQRFPRQR